MAAGMFLACIGVVKKSLRIAMVQCRNWQRSWAGHWPVSFEADAPDEREQLADTGSWIAAAAQAGAEVVVFPELYPGPQAPAEDAFTDVEVEATVRAEARRHGLYVVFNSKVATGAGGTYNQAKVADPEGELVATYNKMIPASGEPNVAGDQPVVFSCHGVPVGLMVCWEMWYPEVARTLRLLGAEVVIAPTGGILYELTDAWRTLLQARALENNCYVGMTVNLFGVEDGLCAVAGPEGMVASHTGEGMTIADLDLERMRYLRSLNERLVVPKPYRAVPGLLRWLPSSVVDAYCAAARQSGEVRR